MRVALWTAGTVVVLMAMHLLALWMERRGWIFYKHTRASSSAASNAVMSVQALFEPQAEYVVQRRSSDEVEEDDSGDPPAQWGLD